uniref:E3 ubiquitin-protein ligase MARCH3 n=1 Tax=Anthurium amnicola TaxID=1678845 RepID=A0A1D1YZR1_9ARAE
MGAKAEQVQLATGGFSDGSMCSSTDCQVLDSSPTVHRDMEKERSYAICRVCHCVESDRMGDAALGYLNIIPPLQDSKANEDCDTMDQMSPGAIEKDVDSSKNCRRECGVVEFISPDGEIFVCSADVEAGSCYQQDLLTDLGCSCKSELALAHYACALKWFVSHGSTICEICGNVAKNIRPMDFKKVTVSLKDYESLRERTATGELDHSRISTDSGVDPDAVAAIRRQKLSEISLWFNPHNNFTAVPQETVDQPSNIATENAPPTENPTTKWAVEGTGILVATGLLTVTLAWLIAPRVGKKTAKNGLHILLGGICALTVVIFLRFVVLSRIKYGPARYWAILFVFWFLVFGIWASRTHSAHSS